MLQNSAEAQTASNGDIERGGVQYLNKYDDKSICKQYNNILSTDAIKCGE